MNFVLRSVHTLYNIVNNIAVPLCESALVQGDLTVVQAVCGAVSILAMMTFIKECDPQSFRLSRVKSVWVKLLSKNFIVSFGRMRMILFKFE